MGAEEGSSEGGELPSTGGGDAGEIGLNAGCAGGADDRTSGGGGGGLDERRGGRLKEKTDRELDLLRAGAMLLLS